MVVTNTLWAPHPAGLGGGVSPLTYFARLLGRLWGTATTARYGYADDRRPSGQILKAVGPG
jgi:hypothetical protein